MSVISNWIWIFIIVLTLQSLKHIHIYKVGHQQATKHTMSQNTAAAVLR